MVDYETGRREFTLDVPEHFNFGFDIVDGWATREPDKLALLSVDANGENPCRLTFRELSLASNRFANVLAGLGLRKGDRVLVMLPRIHEWYEAVLGMIKLGVIPMPTTTQCTAKDIEYRIGKSEASMVVTDAENAEKVEQAAKSCDGLVRLMAVRGRPGDPWLGYEDEVGRAADSRPGVEPSRSDDPMLLYFTSGTVAYPKMVIHTQASYGIGHTITARFWQDLKPSDLHWTISDMGWAKAAWGKLFGQWTMGAAVFLHDARGRFDPEIALRIIARYGVTTFCAPPTVYRVLVQEDLVKSSPMSLRHCTAAGEPLNPEVMMQWREKTGLDIHDGYGQTETVNLVANYPCVPIRPGSMGKPAPGFEIAVLDEDGLQAGPGLEGSIAVRVRPRRPIGLFREYWKDPERTSEVFAGEWYLTGDRAVMDEEGYFWFVGRADDVIISSGYRIGPFEVESALLEHPAVTEAAAVASPDELRGEVVKAFVVLAGGRDGSEQLAKELQEHVKSVTAPYKYPRVIEFVDDLPKTISGKIKRGELKRREWGGRVQQ